MAHGPNSKFNRCIAVVLAHEGGFVEHPRDPGGATNMGITRATLAEWRERDVSVEEVRSLTEAEARAIYFARYWVPIRGDELPPGLDLAVLDFAVHSGPRRAARTLQRVLGVAQDGAIGRETLGAARTADRTRVIDEICDLRLAFLRGLPTWEAFGRGWARRVAAVRAEAHTMARRGLPTAEAVQTDTVKASTVTAASITAAVAAAQEVVPLIEAVTPMLTRLGPVVLIALVAALVIAGVIWWRKRRA